MPKPNPPEFLAAAFASGQTEFESSDFMPHGPSGVLITQVAGAPLQAQGCLGSDGRWYITYFMFSAPGEDGATMTWLWNSSPNFREH
jgi:hypothetical protein